MKDRLNKMKGILEAQMKTEPRNAEAWRELAQVKICRLAA